MKGIRHSFEALCFIYNNVSCIRYKVIIILRKLEVLCNGAFHQCIKRENIISKKSTVLFKPAQFFSGIHILRTAYTLRYVFKF